MRNTSVQSLCECIESVSQGAVDRLVINVANHESVARIVTVIWPMWERLRCGTRSWTFSGDRHSQINADRRMRLTLGRYFELPRAKEIHPLSIGRRISIHHVTLTFGRRLFALPTWVVQFSSSSPKTDISGSPGALVVITSGRSHSVTFEVAARRSGCEYISLDDDGGRRVFARGSASMNEIALHRSGPENSPTRFPRRRSLFQSARFRGMKLNVGNEWWDIRDFSWFASVDVAGSESRAAAFSAVCVWARSHAGHLLLVRVVRKRTNLPTFMRLLTRLTRRHRLSAIWIESNGPGLGLIQHAAAHGLPVRPLCAKGSKLERACLAIDTLREKNVLTIEREVWFPDFADELASFPYGPHSDQVDAFVHGILASSSNSQ